MAIYRIYPSIGFARVGGDDDFFLGPEIPGQGPIELDGATVTRFKSTNHKLIRKQAARFRLFQSDDGGTTWLPAELPASATVEWSVTLHNKKAAVVRSSEPPTSPQRPVMDPAAAAMSIQPPTATISGPGKVGTPIEDTFTTTGNGGTPFNAQVKLGQLRTDAEGRLIVLGGDGISDSPTGTPIGGLAGTTYYKNPKWYDDVADGPVTATIKLTPDAEPIAAEGGAWVIVGPPDFAPGIGGIVTLYDVVRQVGIDQLGFPPPPLIPSFDRDIMPIIRRARRHRWVHNGPQWGNAAFDASDADLRSKDPAKDGIKEAVRKRILLAEDVTEGGFAGHTSPAGPPFKLRKHQTDALNAWLARNFDDKPAPFDATPTAEGLTRAALEGAVGQGFCPGIEAGILVLDKTIYRSPFDFRIDHASVAAGDLTALMAQPWQADFLKCHTEWWPSQRPDLAPQSNDFEDNKRWIRGIGGSEHGKLVKEFQRLGFIVQTGPESFVEAERDTTFPVA
ncbi:LodA/GoxA family CTQ-dependent oxidase [Bradyrhizobium sp. AUGA SZCCT0177]|uniref:LodA/GoxA family CTQ-dependent oxidase n=1 Tax=Bradyrhizobium sp. AUGA SZCCT0177 TaxID=2807665 RepID=UPI001BAC18B6|nr:LodA/GoxA family CTQ-dependent oxidase [Bradyrhizobium sp. AUGA SZCCT0177]MBR1286208.1 LodA/GoxA family CTQ-dependent oxidase [Bradyrhizobium sp. AUGA SZCCT0177]